MKKSLFNYLFYSFILFFVGVISVYAYYPTVSINKDLITASYTSSGRFYINNSSDFSTSSYFQSTEKGGWIDTSTNKKAMVSVKNGTYYVWIPRYKYKIFKYAFLFFVDIRFLKKHGLLLAVRAVSLLCFFTLLSRMVDVVVKASALLAFHCLAHDKVAYIDDVAELA